MPLAMRTHHARVGDVSLAYGLQGEKGPPLIYTRGADELLAIETVQGLVSGSALEFREAGCFELEGLGKRRLLAATWLDELRSGSQAGGGKSTQGPTSDRAERCR